MDKERENAVVEKLRMHRGALAMLDILGFKGIWRRHPAEEVVGRLVAMSEQIPRASEYTFPGFAGISLRRSYMYWGTLSLHFSFLSDTIVIGLSHEDQSDACADQVALQAMGKIVAQVSQTAIEGAPALAIRGAISVGDFAIQDRFIIGEAVDEAASHMNLPDGAFVWVVPSAAHVLACIPQAHLGHFFVDHALPLKDGRHIRALVARHWDSTEDDGTQASLRTRLLATFARSVDIEIKRQNTEDFLNVAAAAPTIWEYQLPALGRPDIPEIHGGMDDLWSDGGDWRTDWRTAIVRYSSGDED